MRVECMSAELPNVANPKSSRILNTEHRGIENDPFCTCFDFRSSLARPRAETKTNTETNVLITASRGPWKKFTLITKNIDRRRLAAIAWLASSTPFADVRIEIGAVRVVAKTKRAPTLQRWAIS